jgi:hypothetical protein
VAVGKTAAIVSLLGRLFTIVLAGLASTIACTFVPVTLPELRGAHMYA